MPKKRSNASQSDAIIEGGTNFSNSISSDSGINNSINAMKPSSIYSKDSNLGSVVLLPSNGNRSFAMASGVYQALPSFGEVLNAEKGNLFISKLSMCCVVFDFNDPAANLREKDIKRQTLLELVDYLSSSNSKFDEVAVQEITKMVAINLFRSLPSSNHDGEIPQAYDLEEEELVQEPAWPHLQVVYEFLFRFVASSETDVKLAKRYVDRFFLLRLLELFDSEDQRERDYLKTILHRIYGKFIVHRPFIRKAISNIFYHFIFETEKHSGIAELLEILGSIISGFALPLKEEHKLFLTRALIPLHKLKCAPMYHRQLSHCMTQFVEKDAKLADTVIRALLKYWPITNSSKEVMFLGELEEVLEATQAEAFQLCMVPLFRQINRCLNSLHFQVAERALSIWNNDHIRNLILQNSKVILPIILPALEKNTRGHWNQTVQSLTLNVRITFLDADQAHFEECLFKFEEGEIEKKYLKDKRASIWKQLEDLAASKASNETVLRSRFASSVAIMTPSQATTCS